MEVPFRWVKEITLNERGTYVQEIVVSEAALDVTVLGKDAMRMSLLDEKPIRKSKGAEENDIPVMLRAKKKEVGWEGEELVLPVGKETLLIEKD